MAQKDESIRHELEEIKIGLRALQDSMRRATEGAPQAEQALGTQMGRTDLLEVMVSQSMDDVEEGLSKNMVKRCDMKEPCRATFTAFLQKNAALLERDVVREEVIITNQDEFDRLRSTAPYDKCDRCFNEVSRLFGKQVRLMRSLRIFTTTADKRQEISELQEGDFVANVLEPIASRSRLQMLKAVSTEPKTFSGLGEATGLRGGNLLFHIQKLLDAGMMVQRHNRGDYMITEKGFKVLKGVSDVHQMLTH